MMLLQTATNTIFPTPIRDYLSSKLKNFFARLTSQVILIIDEYWDPELKQAILDDLDRFISRNDFYRRIGKTWKRGYLLDDPSRTGKSSLVAAMAKYLKFDVYDLELTSIHSNSNLRNELLGITNRSILVVEDVDSNAEVQDRSRYENSYNAYMELKIGFHLFHLLL
ncbi:hypothetical protein CRYUN_Cryun15aG0138900 [Craigia yunnanensis]